MHLTYYTIIFATNVFDSVMGRSLYCIVFRGVGLETVRCVVVGVACGHQGSHPRCGRERMNERSSFVTKGMGKRETNFCYSHLIFPPLRPNLRQHPYLT